MFADKHPESSHLSHDGHWMLYQSNQSGQAEIYVRRYPRIDRQWQVSEGGGVRPSCSTTGREIYYRRGHHIMAVAVDSSGRHPTFGKPAALFADEFDVGQSISIPSYDCHPRRPLHYAAPRFAGKQSARGHPLVRRAKTDSRRRRRSLVFANYLPPAAMAMTWMRADSACGGKVMIIVSPAATVQKSPALRCSFFPAISVSIFPDLSCAI
jgi:hypothetical protein